ncbi:MAG: fatty acid desaturase [Thiobacillaceae bacterium]
MNSHNAIIRHRYGRALLEFLLWGLNGVPVILWQRLHNQTHHAETNTMKDTDRLFVEKERSTSTTFYARLFLPSRSTLKYNPLVLFHFVTYIVRHSVSALMPGAAKLPIVTSKPKYSARQYSQLLAGIGFIGLLQTGIWFIVGQDWGRYVWASPIALLVTSSVVMTYIFTNHHLNPLCEFSDPLVGSTSVIVPNWMDWLHDNFSYHTEHHVFPGMNPKFFPEVSRLLHEHFPDRYNRIPLREAWKRIWLQDEFIQMGD